MFINAIEVTNQKTQLRHYPNPSLAFLGFLDFLHNFNSIYYQTTGTRFVFLFSNPSIIADGVYIKIYEISIHPLMIKILYSKLKYCNFVPEKAIKNLTKPPCSLWTIKHPIQPAQMSWSIISKYHHDTTSFLTLL